MQPNQNNQQPQQQQYPQQPGGIPPVPQQQGYPQQQPGQNPGIQPQPAAQPAAPMQDASLTHEQPIDYLNQINSNPVVHTKKSKFLMFLIIGLSILTMLVFALSLSTQKESPASSLVTLSLRVSTITAISEEYSDKLRDSDLLKNSSDLNISLANINKDIQPALAASGVEEATEYSEKLTAKNGAYDTEIRSDFDEAILNVKFDSTYARQMAFEITEIRALLEKIYPSVKESVKKSLVTIDGNLEAIEKKLRAFTADK